MKILNVTIFTFLLFISNISNGWGQVEIKVDPPNPIKGESFNVTFKVSTDTNEDPFVSFTPIGLEVLGRRKEVSLQTTMINGKFTSSRNYNLVYELVSDKQRTARLSDIIVEVGSKKYEHKPVLIKVLGQRKKASPLFLRAEVSKDQVYVGEGVDVRYYLYSRVQVVQTEIKTFPKLKGFIKRFHKVDEREEAVEVNGLVYKRSLKYSARIYPEKTGKLSVDPLRLVLQYTSGRGNPFGGIGFGFGRFRTKRINSSRVEINVQALPAENVPPHFTGLVGEHSFNFVQSKNKFVVNEAIEGSLEVRGPGALEKLEAPKLYSNESLEQFDAKGEFVEIGRSLGRKIFEYTYLARANISIAAKNLPLAYFDPETKEYVTVEVALPELNVVGGASTGTSQDSLPNPVETRPDAQVAEASPLSRDLTINAPLFSERWNSIPLKWPFIINIFLSLVLLLMVFELAFKKIKGIKTRGDASKIIFKLKKDGMSYSDISKLIFILGKSSNKMQGDLHEIIKSSQMPEKDKDYFLEVLRTLEEKSFASEQKNSKKARFRASSFNELKKVIEHESM